MQGICKTHLKMSAVLVFLMCLCLFGGVSSVTQLHKFEGEDVTLEMNLKASELVAGSYQWFAPDYTADVKIVDIIPNRTFAYYDYSGIECTVLDNYDLKIHNLKLKNRGYVRGDFIYRNRSIIGKLWFLNVTRRQLMPTPHPLTDTSNVKISTIMSTTRPTTTTQTLTIAPLHKPTLYAWFNVTETECVVTVTCNPAVDDVERKLNISIIRSEWKSSEPYLKMVTDFNDLETLSCVVSDTGISAAANISIGCFEDSAIEGHGTTLSSQLRQNVIKEATYSKHQSQGRWKEQLARTRRGEGTRYFGRVPFTVYSNYSIRFRNVSREQQGVYEMDFVTTDGSAQFVYRLDVKQRVLAPNIVIDSESEEGGCNVTITCLPNARNSLMTYTVNISVNNVSVANSDMVFTMNYSSTVSVMCIIESLGQSQMNTEVCVCEIEPAAVAHQHIGLYLVLVFVSFLSACAVLTVLYNKHCKRMRRGFPAEQAPML